MISSCHFDTPGRHRGYRLLLAAAFALLLGGCSLFGIRSVEEAGYTLLSASEDIELRRYDSYVTIETRIDADFDEAGDRAFRKLFDYISGANRESRRIDMTAPVIASDTANEGTRIDMTAPVLAAEDSGGWRFAFVLPAEFDLQNAPLPLDPELVLVENPSRQVAVLRFSGTWGKPRFDERLPRLLEWIEQNDLRIESGPRFAGYDPPWTLPFLRRNEILITVDS